MGNIIESKCKLDLINKKVVVEIDNLHSSITAEYIEDVITEALNDKAIHCFVSVVVADARLIAAAPELLVACEAYVEAQNLQQSDDALQMMLAAITKAKSGV